jgi:4-phospho-D-threonate 3-dehydrogenase / 4-phospho-D-erythronate 3-dehydrogenase
MSNVICVPMGDPAGVGPEIVAASIGDPVVAGETIVVVGGEATLRRAGEIMKVSPEIRRLDGAGDIRAQARPGMLNLVAVDDSTLTDFEFGKVQASCGRLAYDCIEKAVKLAMAGKVDAVATTAINKEALKAAQVPFIGHTEIFAALTGSNDPLTMFQVHDLRVFFLSRHLSLIEACRKVTKARLVDYIERCTLALRQLGIDNASLAVAGLNPHCGEHGLFGDEEMREVAPAVAEARAAGFNVVGPRPADSVFHFAAEGAWDAVLSLYHDQGHIATKMVDFHRTISLTLGMPILRTSVDHGTAFDIAGTGRVNPVSMVEAIRLAALYAGNFRKNAPAAAGLAV